MSVQTDQNVSQIRSSRNLSHGFNLVEVTLALGIVAFSLLAIINLLPAGMKAFQDAMRLNVEAEIVQTIARELENTSWKSPTQVGLPANPPANLKQFIDQFPLWFDDEGREIGSGPTPPTPSPGDPRSPLYGVHILLNDANVQGATFQSGSGSQLLYRARIFIAYRRLENLPNRVSSGTIAPEDRPWIKEYPVVLSYKGF